MKIGNKELGTKPYIIAEAGMNHGGTIEGARALIKAAADAGADAIKFQTYTADELVLKGTPRFWDFDEDDGRDQYEAYEAIPKLDYDDYPELMRYCEECGIEFLSTPFSFEAADELNELGVKAFKIASSDMSTLPFLKHVARFGKPILLSTGAATMEEVQEAVQTIRDEGNDQIVVMQCTLCYPTKNEDANLQVIATYKKKFPDLIVGLSDHTIGVHPSCVAIALGADVLEKHFTTDKTLKGNADHWLSVDPTELEQIVRVSRDFVEHPLQTMIRVLNPEDSSDSRKRILVGRYEKKVLDCEVETRKYDKRSIVTRVDIKQGQTITEDLLTYKRPGIGIWPNRLNDVIGTKASEDIPANTLLRWEQIT